MPIYMKIDGVRGTVTDHDHKNRSGASNGGVWRTTNFLTADPVSRSASRPQTPIKTIICPTDTSTVRVSRLSLFGRGNAVDGRDPSARFKVEQLINTARSQGPNGKLFVATDAGVYQGAGGGIGRSGRATVEIIVTDFGGSVVGSYRLQNAGVSRHSGGVLVALGDGSVKF